MDSFRVSEPKAHHVAESLLQVKASLPSKRLVELSCSHLFNKHIFIKCILCAKHSSGHWGYIKIPVLKVSILVGKKKEINMRHIRR